MISVIIGLGPLVYKTQTGIRYKSNRGETVDNGDRTQNRHVSQEIGAIESIGPVTLKSLREAAKKGGEDGAIKNSETREQ